MSRLIGVILGASAGFGIGLKLGLWTIGGENFFKAFPYILAVIIAASITHELAKNLMENLFVGFAFFLLGVVCFLISFIGRIGPTYPGDLDLRSIAPFILSTPFIGFGGIIGYENGEEIFDVLTERFLMSIVHLKYLFSGESVEEAILKRREKKMRQEEERAYQNELKASQREVREKRRNLQEKLHQLQKSHPEELAKAPEILEYLISLDLVPRGFFGEIERRFHDEQIRKSLAKRKEAVAEARYLIQEVTDLAESLYEAKEKDKRLRIKLDRLEKGEVEEKAELEMDIERLKLKTEKARQLKELRRASGEEEDLGEKAERLRQEREIAELERDIQKIKREPESLGERRKRDIEKLKVELDTKVEAIGAKFEAELGAREKFRDLEKKVKKEKFGDRDYDDLSEEEKEEYDFITEFFMKGMDKI